MKYDQLMLVLFLGTMSSLPVLLIKQFYEHNKMHFTTTDIIILLLKISVSFTLISFGYFYFIYHKISIATFYPLIKIVEILIPISVVIFYYNNAKYKLVNYIGIILAILAIIMINY